MTTYNRGYGGITLTGDQVTALGKLLHTQEDLYTSDNATANLGVPIYQMILDDISRWGEMGSEWIF